MEINTRDFGKVSVEDNSVYTFPHGIYGFEEDTEFALFVQTLDGLPFLYLQSTKNDVPCFLVFEPEEFVDGYSPSLTAEDLAVLEAKDTGDLVRLVIATVPSDVSDLSLNLKSPIVLNPATKKAGQFILRDSDYPIKYHPFKAEENGGKDGA